MSANINQLKTYLQYVAGCMEARLQQAFGQSNTYLPPLLPRVIKPEGAIEQLIDKHGLSNTEVVVFMLALAPHLQIELFDSIIQPYMVNSGDFQQIGGVRSKNGRSFLPTGQTAAFILAGDDLEKRLQVAELFHHQHVFARQNILYLEEVPDGEPALCGRIVLQPEYIELLVTGTQTIPKLSMNFPAQYLETTYIWEDLILNTSTRQQIVELENWVNYQKVLMTDWGMDRKLKPGYRALFHGPPGTGKTLTASLLGKYTNKQVFRIDLSMIVSKFIGETEKNLSQLFLKAENKNWILFFDEADALFGKRTNVKDAHDKYANQEASYLLQRIEQHEGLVILATNFKNNIDEAFMRRFQSVIHFPLPNAEERHVIWKKSFPQKANLNGHINLEQIARKYELSGSGILNVVQFACLQMLAKKAAHVTQEVILEGIEREYTKENRVW
ncbi:AAA+-type ATPase, SpoVK/Ycf46/Vps4 family [Mucilaginibacter pineti]|uniref:AAA+-type ATPase, SpoVK/Ycf46/Vps4 family n=1 Tax=Mucilaginibacter pineti TaxID=1391627 RepID=A0A1G6WQ01_9SPHI|nr:ATP-binding protein [Mucilaginibacter pineti]SDD67891.1 AAA+-type ATPase, SpoVK/Ycf46/Vps4 family [Mucilaginibacter pineti]